MPTVICNKQKDKDILPDNLLATLPAALRLELNLLAADGVCIDEIRVRVGRRVCVTSRGENIRLEYVTSQSVLDDIVLKICDGSIYAHVDSIKCGYVTLSGGIRVGIVGRAAVENGQIIGVYDVSALCFRLPRRVEGVGGVIAELIRSFDREGGVLIYSPPGEGKTTLLRSVIKQLSLGERAKRICVVDTRGELCPMLDGERLCIDALSGYPKAIGIEIAARCMNPQLIVCDEIGGVEEARAISVAQNCGVPLLATAHAASLAGLMRREGIALLHRSGVFQSYVGIKRQISGSDYAYMVATCEEADEYI